MDQISVLWKMYIFGKIQESMRSGGDGRTGKKKSILFALAAVCLPLALSAQKEREITLNEAIAMARIQSVDAAVALNELKTAYWEFRTFRADLLPEVNLTGTLPNYNKSYSSYQNSDGSYGFVRNNTLGLTGDLSIDQNIWLTGGKLSLTSSLDYIKQLFLSHYNLHNPSLESII